MSSYEAQQYTCRDIKLELAKMDAFDDQVKQEAKFSAMSVASFLGDFGIGNVAARHAAEKSSAQRRSELEALSASKGCDTANASAAPATQGAPVAPNTSDTAAVVLAAQKIATDSGCGDVSSQGDGRFESQCSSYRMVIACDGTQCRPVRAVR